MSAARLTGAEGWVAIAPVPAQPGQPSVASERRCKLLLESIEDSLAKSTTTLSVVPHEHARAASLVTGSTPTRRLCTAISARSADNESTARDVP